MILDTAKEIASLWFANSKMDSIKILRAETSMGLINAKTYLEEHAMGGEENLLKQLQADFVKDPRDLLREALHQRQLLDLHIADLEAAIEWEDEENSRETEKAS